MEFIDQRNFKIATISVMSYDFLKYSSNLVFFIYFNINNKENNVVILIIWAKPGAKVLSVIVIYIYVNKPIKQPTKLNKFN